MAYIKRLSLGTQFEHQIEMKIKNFSYEKQYQIMKILADKVVDSFKDFRKFYNVTGNAYTSFYAVVYYKGKIKYVSRSSEGEKDPTRPTLAKGEFYDLDYYYDGDPVGKRPYRGSVGKGGQKGPNLIYGRMGKFDKPEGEWALMCVCPVEYAKFNERILQTTYETYERIGTLVDFSVMAVKGSSFNIDK